MERREYTEAEYKAQRLREKEIEALITPEASGERSKEDIQEATIMQLVFNSEHRKGLYKEQGSSAYYSFEEALLLIFGYDTFHALRAEALKRIAALRSKYPI